MIRIILIIGGLIIAPLLVVFWSVRRVSGMCSRDEEKRGKTSRRRFVTWPFGAHRKNVIITPGCFRKPRKQ